MKTISRRTFTAVCAIAALCASPLFAWRLPGFTPKPTDKNFFPIGIFGVTRPESVPLIKAAGFNTVQSYASKPEQVAALAAACARNDIKLVVSPFSVIKSPYDDAARRKWPVLAWYLHDEPDIDGTTPAQLFLKYMEVKNWSQDQRSVFVVSEGKAAVAFGKSADAVMVDWYPVPHLPLESAGMQVDTTAKALQLIDLPHKPVWAVLQAFNWLYYPQHSKNRIGRYPTAQEMRFMTYHSILAGAKGIFYFTFTNRQTGLPITEYPEPWHGLTGTVKEINALRPVFEEGIEVPAPVQCEKPLLCRAWKYRGKTYLIAANAANQYTTIPKGLADGHKWSVLFERSTGLTDLVQERQNPYFNPYRVFVLRGK